MGFSTTITLVLTCPPFIVAGAAGILFGWSSGRMHERTWHITVGLTIAIVGFVIAPSTMNVPARYVACFIFAVGAYSVNSVIIGWAASTLSQTPEKKAVRSPPPSGFSFSHTFTYHVPFYILLNNLPGTDTNTRFFPPSRSSSP